MIGDDLSNSLNASPSRQIRKIESYVRHPDFNFKSGTNDIAVLFVRNILIVDMYTKLWFPYNFHSITIFVKSKKKNHQLSEPFKATSTFRSVELVNEDVFDESTCFVSKCRLYFFSWLDSIIHTMSPFRLIDRSRWLAMAWKRFFKSAKLPGTGIGWDYIESIIWFHFWGK